MDVRAVCTKPIFPISHRSASIFVVRRKRRVSAKTDSNSCAASVDAGTRCAGIRKTSFHVIGRDYFAREAHQHFATEAVAFFLLMMTAVLPLFNGANAVLELIRSAGGAF
jgi:hypothetical protein